MKGPDLKSAARHAFYRFCRHLCIGSFALFTAVRYFDVPEVRSVQRGLLIASNHQSFLDPVLVGMAWPVPINYLARSSLFRTPGFATLIRALGARPVRRGRMDRSGLRTILHLLRQDRPLLMFPEGTRTRDGSVGAFRPGAGRLALRCRVPVLPVCIEGAYGCWPRHRTVPRPGRVAVAFGRFVEPAGTDGRELTRRVRDEILRLQRRLRRYLKSARPELWPGVA